MLFESNEYMMENGNVNFKEEEYPFLVNEIIEHIDKVKKDNKDAALIDIIIDYAFKKNIDVAAIGDAIKSDVYFKSFIEKDCEMHKLIKTNKDAIDKW